MRVRITETEIETDFTRYSYATTEIHPYRLSYTEMDRMSRICSFYSPEIISLTYQNAELRFFYQIILEDLGRKIW